MQQLFPTAAADVDPADVYAAVPRAPHAERPHVLTNMIESLDGTISIDGRSGGLGGPADKMVFAAIRAVADVILVAAGTVRAEQYGPAKLNTRLRTARRARGQAEVPQIAVVSGSLDLDYGAPLFAESRPLVVTTNDADPGRREQAAARADVVIAGSDRVDVSAALAALAERGARVVLCEGGPSLNGQLLSAGLVDEVCVTLAPCLVGGDGPRISGSRPVPPTWLHLHHVLSEDGYVFFDYLAAPR